MIPSVLLVVVIATGWMTTIYSNLKEEDILIGNKEPTNILVVTDVHSSEAHNDVVDKLFKYLKVNFQVRMKQFRLLINICAGVWWSGQDLLRERSPQWTEALRVCQILVEASTKRPEGLEGWLCPLHSRTSSERCK